MTFISKHQINRLSMALRFTVSAALCFFTAATSAAEFAVQVGAYRTLNQETVDLAESVAPVSTQTRGNLTRLLVGSYSSRADAASDLAKLHANGFEDAFITSKTGAKAHVGNASSSDHAHKGHSHGGKHHVHLPSGIQKQIDQLPRSERDNVVILDGRLHRKEGDQFIPL